MQGNIEGNYQVNFAGMFPKSTICAELKAIIGPVVNMIMWSGIEACASTICANLPCYGPLLKRGPSLSYILGVIRSAFSLSRTLFSRGSSSKTTFVESGSTERFAKEPEVSHNSTTVERGIRGGRLGPDLELGEFTRPPLTRDR